MQTTTTKNYRRTDDRSTGVERGDAAVRAVAPAAHGAARAVASRRRSHTGVYAAQRDERDIVLRSCFFHLVRFVLLVWLNVVRMCVPVRFRHSVLDFIVDRRTSSDDNRGLFQVESRVA